VVTAGAREAGFSSLLVIPVLEYGRCECMVVLYTCRLLACFLNDLLVFNSNHQLLMFNLWMSIISLFWDLISPLPAGTIRDWHPSP
jgi:hypothetical protein